MVAMAGLSLPARAALVDYPVVKLQSLDKVSARTLTFEVKVGSTVKYGPLYIKVDACRKAPPIEAPESASFLQIWEVDTHKNSRWVFSGWMFASSPSLSPMDDPVYDVWVLDCLDHKTGEATPAPPALPPASVPPASVPPAPTKTTDTPPAAPVPSGPARP